MKKFFLFLLFLVFLIDIVSAQEEEAKYNFGSAQPAKELTIAPGDEVTTKLYFYNIHGNRITHISLEVGEAPENWVVSIDPPLHETSVIVSGVTATVDENLFVEPGSDVAESIPDDVPEGTEYISSPVGFVGAKPVKVKIKVPSDEKLGTVAAVRIDAVAEWLGQTGAAAIAQSRSFEYKVTVVSKEFTEEIVSEVPDAAEEAKEALPLPAEAVEQGQGAAKAKGGLVPLLVIVIILMAAFIVVLLRKKR